MQLFLQTEDHSIEIIVNLETLSGILAKRE
jgi:hypothetical protein